MCPLFQSKEIRAVFLSFMNTTFYCCQTPIGRVKLGGFFVPRPPPSIIGLISRNVGYRDSFKIAAKVDHISGLNAFLLELFTCMAMVITSEKQIETSRRTYRA